MIRITAKDIMTTEVMAVRADWSLQRLAEFLVEKSNECTNLKTGDSIVCEQKNLTIIKKIPVTKVFDVQKFVVMENHYAIIFN